MVKQYDGIEGLQMDLEKLTEMERVIILNVLQRDDEIQKGRDQKLSELKTEVHGIRLKGVLREGDSADRLCARCHQPLGRIFNTGDICQQCRFKVCQKCRESTFGRKWLCVLCYKQRQISLLAGEWYLPKDIKNAQKKNTMTAPDLIRASMRQPRHKGNIANGDIATVNGDIANSTSSENTSHKHYPLNNGNFNCPRSKDIRMLQQLTGGRSPEHDVDHINGGLVVRRVITNRYKDSDTDDDRSYDENRNNSNSRFLPHQDSGIASTELSENLDNASLSSDNSYYQRVKPTSQLPVEENFMIRSPQNYSPLSSLTSSPSPSQCSVTAEINPTQRSSRSMAPQNNDFVVEELTHVKFHRLSQKSVDDDVELDMDEPVLTMREERRLSDTVSDNLSVITEATEACSDSELDGKKQSRNIKKSESLTSADKADFSFLMHDLDQTLKKHSGEDDILDSSSNKDSVAQSDSFICERKDDDIHLSIDGEVLIFAATPPVVKKVKGKSAKLKSAGTHRKDSHGKKSKLASGSYNDIDHHQSDASVAMTRETNNAGLSTGRKVMIPDWDDSKGSPVSHSAEISFSSKKGIDKLCENVHREFSFDDDHAKAKVTRDSNNKGISQLCKNMHQETSPSSNEFDDMLKTWVGGGTGMPKLVIDNEDRKVHMHNEDYEATPYEKTDSPANEKRDLLRNKVEEDEALAPLPEISMKHDVVESTLLDAEDMGLAVHPEVTLVNDSVSSTSHIANTTTSSNSHQQIEAETDKSISQTSLRFKKNDEITHTQESLVVDVPPGLGVSSQQSLEQQSETYLTSPRTECIIEDSISAQQTQPGLHSHRTSSDHSETKSAEHTYTADDEKVVNGKSSELNSGNSNKKDSHAKLSSDLNTEVEIIGTVVQVDVQHSEVSHDDDLGDRQVSYSSANTASDANVISKKVHQEHGHDSNDGVTDDGAVNPSNSLNLAKGDENVDVHLVSGISSQQSLEKQKETHVILGSENAVVEETVQYSSREQTNHVSISHEESVPISPQLSHAEIKYIQAADEKLVQTREDVMLDQQYANASQTDREVTSHGDDQIKQHSEDETLLYTESVSTDNASESKDVSDFSKKVHRVHSQESDDGFDNMLKMWVVGGTENPSNMSDDLAKDDENVNVAFEFGISSQQSLEQQRKTPQPTISSEGTVVQETVSSSLEQVSHAEAKDTYAADEEIVQTHGDDMLQRQYSSTSQTDREVTDFTNDQSKQHSVDVTLVYESESKPISTEHSSSDPQHSNKKIDEDSEFLSTDNESIADFGVSSKPSNGHSVTISEIMYHDNVATESNDSRAEMDIALKKDVLPERHVAAEKDVAAEKGHVMESVVHVHFNDVAQINEVEQSAGDATMKKEPPSVAGHASAQSEVAEQNTMPIVKGLKTETSTKAMTIIPDEHQTEDGKESVSSPNSSPGGISMPQSDAGSDKHGASLNHQSKSLSSIPSIVVSMEGGDNIFDDDHSSQMPSTYRSGSSINSYSRRGSSHTGSLESLSSMYSSAGVSYGVVTVTGSIQFGLNYKVNTGQLEVFIRQASEVAPVDRKRARSDPYVKIYLLPDKSRASKRKTRIKRHTLNPIFNERLAYHISSSEVKTRVLSVSVWHFDRFGRNVFLGEVIVPLDYFDFAESSPQWYTLQEKSDVHPSEQQSVLTYKGDLDLSIKYMTAEDVDFQNAEHTKSPKSGAVRKKAKNGELHLFVKGARNLTAAKSQGYSDPFCRVRMLPDKGHHHKQKTPILRKNCNPTWEYTVCFDGFSLKQLYECSLEITVWDYDRFSSNEFLGGVRLNLGTGMCHGKDVYFMDAKGEEVSMWQAMLDNPSTWIDYNLVLRPNMDKRK